MSSTRAPRPTPAAPRLRPRLFRTCAGPAGFVAAAILLGAASVHASENLVLIPDYALFGIFGEEGGGIGALWVMLIGFVVLIYPLNALLFQPIFRALDARAERIQGARKRSVQLQADAEGILYRYETAIREARLDAESKRKEQVTAAREEQVALTAAARREAEGEIERARGELARSLEEARATLRASAEDLATAAAEQILGRPLS